MLEGLQQAIQKRLEVEQELKVQEEEQNSAAMSSKRRECQEATEQLALLEKKLGESPTRWGISFVVSPVSCWVIEGLYVCVCISI